MVGEELSARFRRALLQPDRGLRRIRLSRKPRRELRAAGLCLGLAQVPLPGRVRGGAAQRAADGLLRAGADRARRCASTASRCGRSTSIIPTGMRRSSRARSAADAHACAPPRDGGRHPHDPRATARLPPDQGIVGRTMRRLIVARRTARRLQLRPRSLAAHRPVAAPHRAAGRCRCVRLARPQPAAGVVGGKALGRVGDRDDDLPLFRVAAAPLASTCASCPVPREPDRSAAADAARRGRRQRLPLPRPVAERASSVVPARRPRPARHRPQRGAARCCRPARASPSPASSPSASGRARPTASSS